MQRVTVNGCMISDADIYSYLMEKDNVHGVDIDHIVSFAPKECDDEFGAIGEHIVVDCRMKNTAREECLIPVRKLLSFIQQNEPAAIWFTDEV